MLVEDTIFFNFRRYLAKVSLVISELELFRCCTGARNSSTKAWLDRFALSKVNTVEQNSVPSLTLRPLGLQDISMLISIPTSRPKRSQSRRKFFVATFLSALISILPMADATSIVPIVLHSDVKFQRRFSEV